MIAPLSVDFRKREPFWVEATEHRAGYWHPGFSRVTIHAMTMVYPGDSDDEVQSVNDAIDRMIETLKSKKLDPRATIPEPESEMSDEKEQSRL